MLKKAKKVIRLFNRSTEDKILFDIDWDDLHIGKAKLSQAVVQRWIRICKMLLALLGRWEALQAFVLHKDQRGVPPGHAQNRGKLLVFRGGVQHHTRRQQRRRVLPGDAQGNRGRGSSSSSQTRSSRTRPSACSTPRPLAPTLLRTRIDLMTALPRSASGLVWSSPLPWRDSFCAATVRLA
ncbi:unnamed protein product [Ectocarpus fasciculatus]